MRAATASWASGPAAETVTCWQLVAPRPISALADRIMSRRGRFDQFTPVWAEIEARIGLEGTFPPSWFALLFPI